MTLEYFDRERQFPIDFGIPEPFLLGARELGRLDLLCGRAEVSRSRRR